MCYGEIIIKIIWIQFVNSMHVLKYLDHKKPLHGILMILNLV